MQTEKKNYLNEPIKWSNGINAEFPYQTVCDESRLMIRVNDFPEEHFYTLIVDDEEVGDFDDWPDNWIRAEDSEKKQRPGSHRRPQIKVRRQMER